MTDEAARFDGCVVGESWFEMDRSDRSTWTAAIEHGTAKGIPDEQLDFLILAHDV